MANHLMNDSPPEDGPPSTAPESVGGRRPWARLVLRVAEPLSVAALYVYLLEESWLRWPDPLIDFPKNLYIAWRVSVGDRLYDQVNNWYGPLSNLTEGAGFKIFGVGLDTMVWMNITLTAGVLLLLRGIFGLLGHRLSMWLGSLVFVVAFAVAQFLTAGNYNFITPYISQATYTFLGVVLMLWALLRHARSPHRGWLVVAGLGLAIAYLDKPEGLLAALGALGVYLAAQFVRAARASPNLGDWRGAGRMLRQWMGGLAAGFFALWGAVFLYFWSKGGLAYSFLATNYAPYTVLSGTYRHAIINALMMRAFSGFDYPWANFAGQLGAGGMLVGLGAVILVAAWRWSDAKVFGLGWWVWPLVAVAAGAACIDVGEQAHYWVNTGCAFIFPVMLATGWAVWRAGRAAWQNRTDFSQMLGVAMVGVAASLMFTRMILNGRIDHYGFFMMPLAVLYWIHWVTVEPGRVWPKTFRGRGKWLAYGVYSLVILVAVHDLLDVDLLIYSQKTYAVGSGRDRFYDWPPDKLTSGLEVNTMIRLFRADTPGAQTLAVFPEGIAVNYHLRVPSPLAELEFLPLALSYVGPQHVVDELNARPPAAVFLFYRDMSEYNALYFGDSPATGWDIARWLSEHEVIIATAGKPGANTITGHPMDLMTPKPAAGK